jgi:hypothetical protein
MGSVGLLPRLLGGRAFAVLLQVSPDSFAELLQWVALWRICEVPTVDVYRPLSPRKRAALA